MGWGWGGQLGLCSFYCDSHLVTAVNPTAGFNFLLKIEPLLFFYLKGFFFFFLVRGKRFFFSGKSFF